MLKLNGNIASGTKNLFKKISQSSDDIIFIFNPLRRVFIFINPKVEDILGFTENEIKDMGSDALRNLISEEDYEEFSNRYTATISELIRKTSFDFTIRLKTKLGKRKFFHVKLSSLDKLPDGSPKQILGIARDITDFKEKDFLLRNNVHYFRTILSQLHEDIFIINKDYEVVDVNSDYVNTISMERKDIIGKKCYKLFQDYEEPCPAYNKECYLKDVFKTKRSYTYKQTIKNTRHGLRHILIHISPIFDGKGEVENVLETIKDITLEEAALSARLESEKRYRNLFDKAMNMIHILDKDGVITEVNAAWVNKFGYPAEEAIGKHISNFIANKYKGYIKNILEKIKEEKKPIQDNIIYISKTGQNIIVNENKSPIVVNGEVDSIQVILEDITDIERAKEISNQNLLLNGINRILNETFTSESLDEVALFALKISEMITGSQFGMIGLLNKDNNTIELIASTEKNFLKNLSGEEAEKFTSIPIRGILAKVIKNQEPYFTNDYHADPNSYGLPEDHPELFCVLGAPLIIGKKEFGIIVVGNSPIGYSYLDKSNLESLASTISTVLKRKQTDLELLKHKENLEEMLDVRTKEIKELNRSLLEEVALTEKIAKALALSEQRYKRLYENAPIGMYRSNEKGEILLANKYLLDNLGYDSLEDLARNVSAFELYTDQNDRENFIDIIRENGAVYNFETRMVKKDGTIIDVIENANLFYDERDEIYYYEGIIQDVTQQKKDRELIEILSAAIAQTPTFVVVTDTDGTIEYANAAFTKITEFELDEAIGQNPRILKSGYHDEKFYKKLWDTITEGKAWISEFYNKKKSGEFFWTNAIVFPIKNSDGQIIKFVTIQEDITEKKKILAELIKAKEEAEKADKLKSEFLAQISHEIRTPLTSMLSFASLLQAELENVVDEELAYSFEAIKNSAKRITRTIDLILNVAQLETETFEFTPIEIDVNNQILEDIYLEYYQYCKQKKLEFRFTREIPEFNFTGDEYTLNQIFTHIIDNAIKYTDKGTVEIKTYRDEKKRRIVEISDTGIGISNEYLPHLFEKFTQEEQGYTRRYDGNGLGMALVKRFCDLNKLGIEVESEKGKGTTIRVIFPN